MNANHLTKLARLGGLTIVIALFAGGSRVADAQESGSAKGGAAKLIERAAPAAPKSAPSNSKAMSCTKCKDEFSTRVDWTARGANKPVINVARHLCEGCGNDWVVSGHGKAKTSKAVHTCTSCGAESPACCFTTASGAGRTKGM